MTGREGASGPAAVLVSRVGEADGARAIAAALACAGSDADRAALLLELTDGRAPRPTLVASAAARGLEERLAAHLPEAEVASRGMLCHLSLPATREGLDRAPAALALVRDSLGVVLVPPCLLQAATESSALRAGTVVLRADLGRDRALTALAACELIARGVAVAVAKRPLAWVPSRRALFGGLPAGSSGGLPARMLRIVGSDA
jgi:hypothetical protein